MAVVAKSGTPSLCTRLPGADCQISGLLAGEAIAAGDACYIASTGLVMKSNGTAANAAAKVDGFAAINAPSGEAVTLYFDVNFHYGAGLTPGTRLYLFTTAGQIGDAATTGGTGVIGFVIDANRVHLTQSRY